MLLACLPASASSKTTVGDLATDDLFCVSLLVCVCVFCLCARLCASVCTFCVRSCVLFCFSENDMVDCALFMELYEEAMAAREKLKKHKAWNKAIAPSQEIDEDMLLCCNRSQCPFPFLTLRLLLCCRSLLAFNVSALVLSICFFFFSASPHASNLFVLLFPLLTVKAAKAQLPKGKTYADVYIPTVMEAAPFQAQR